MDLKNKWLVIPEEQAKAIGKGLKIAGYTANIAFITEDNLVQMMESLKNKDGKVTLFMTKGRVQITDMPKVAANDQRDRQQHWGGIGMDRSGG